MMATDLLVFRIGRELFAAELAAVEEAVDLTAVPASEPVPRSSSPVRGIVTLRGTLVPVFSPAAAVGVAPDEAATALVVRDGPGRIAILIDDVEDVLTCRDGELRPLPAADGRDLGVVRGVIRRDAMLVAVVDLAALVAACRGAPQPEPEAA